MAERKTFLDIKGRFELIAKKINFTDCHWQVNGLAKDLKMLN